MHSLKSPEKSQQARIIQLVIFHIEDQEFGIPIEEIQEIIKVGNITPIPELPKFITGIINVRGDIVTTIDMRLRFSLKAPKEQPRHIVITKQKDNLFGLMVDEVTEVLRIEEDEIKPPPATLSKIEKAYVKGIVVFGERLFVLLDLPHIFSEKELSLISSLALKGDTPGQKNNKKGVQE